MALIDRQALIDSFCSQCTVDKPETCSTMLYGDKWCNEVYTILNAPTVDAVQVRHGRWIKKRYWSEGAGMGERYGYYYSCSKCGNLVCGGYDECGKKYCDECGARMDGKDDDNETD